MAAMNMGSRDGTVVKALASRQCGPGSIPALCHMCVEFVVGSRLSPSTKTSITKFQFVQDRGPAWKPAKADVASSLNIAI